MITAEQEKYVRIGKNSITEQMQINLRSPEDGKVYVNVGSDSVISGTVNVEHDKIEFGVNEGTTFYCTTGIKVGNDVMFPWGLCDCR